LVGAGRPEVISGVSFITPDLAGENIGLDIVSGLGQSGKYKKRYE